MTLIMPEEVEPADRDREHLFRDDAEVALQHTSLTTVDNPALRDTLARFDSACAPPLELLRSVMTRAMAEVPRAALPDALGHRTITIHGTLFGNREELYPWGNAVFWADGALEFVTGFLGEVGGHGAVLFQDTWTVPWNEDPADNQDAVSGQDDAVHVVEALAEQLGLPVRDVLAAAGIRRSSYYSWKKPNRPRPRVASQGRLWALAQMVEDLAEFLGAEVRPWLLASNSRRDLLVRGEFETLLDTAIAERSVPHDTGAPVWAATYAVGAEHDDPLDADEIGVTERSPRSMRKATPAQVRSSADRRRG